MKLKKGDTIRVIAGNDKGKEGKILRVLPALGVLEVDGVNMKKKHVRARRQGQKGERIEKPAPFPASRVMIVCGSCKNAVRVGYRAEGDTKVRICTKCQKEL